MEAITAVRNFLEGHWQTVVDAFGGDERLMFGLGTALVLFVPFIIVNSFLAVLDFTGKPAFLVKFKITEERNVPLDKGRYIRCLLLATFNEATTCVVVVLCYPLMKACGMSGLNPLPPLWKAILTSYLLDYINEFVFYYGHRLLHWPPLYKRFHKVHHEWVSPISVSASYQHPVDNFIAKTMAFFVGPIVCGSHLSIAWLWILQGQISTHFHHSGYHFPGLSSPQFHDFHHLRFTECYGSTGLLDGFHKTDVNFRQSIQCRRDKCFYSFSSIREQIPDEKRQE